MFNFESTYFDDSSDYGWLFVHVFAPEEKSL